MFISLKNTSLFLLLSLLATIRLVAQPANKSVPLPKKSTSSQNWADSVYNSLNLDQKIGQLFMVAAYSGGEKINREAIEQLIVKNFIGGLIFMQGTAEAQAEMTNAYQGKSKIPLMIAMDAEWGLGMRLKGVQDFPRQMMMGAMADNTIVYKLGKAVADQCKRLGVHVNFAPVVDINNNPDNPVINFRSFGEDKFKVADLGIQYMRGMQENGVMACAKHFPGHGNTSTDSHLDLPTINGTKKELMDLELYPFRELISASIGSIMIAHLQVPALDNTPKTPTTLSKKVVTELLKDEMNYKGLIFTDALNMEGVAKYYAPGEVDLKAFLAGNDVLLFSKDVPTAIQKIKQALNNESISEVRLAESVKKILRAKYELGLYEFKKIKEDGVTADLNKYTSSIRTQIAKEALTLVNDKNDYISKIVKGNYKRKILITIGSDTLNSFSNAMEQQGFRKVEESASNIAQARDADFTLISIHGMTPYPKDNFGISNARIESINKLLKFNNTFLVIFGNPYIIKNFCEIKELLVAYDDKPETHLVAANIFQGMSKPRGTLPVSVCENYAAGSGIVSDYSSNESRQDNNNNTGSISAPKIQDQEPRVIDKEVDQTAERFAGLVAKPFAPATINCCVNPSVIGADISKLQKIDAFLNDCVAKKAFPGCRVMIAREGKVFYDKSFGYLDNSKSTKVEEGTLYDIASVTKVMSTTLAVMRLVEKGKLNLNGTLGDYLPMTKGTNKSTCKISDLLLHQAGLETWIPFYKSTFDSMKQRRIDVYSSRYSSLFSIKVADGMFMNKNYLDSMWTRILEGPVGAKVYSYSDLDFIFLQKVVEKISGMKLDAYVDKEFYKPLGLKSICFNPLSKGKKLKEIAPSEMDNYWRYQDVQGYVHDMAAAMFGGVSGHAGLFSNTYDISVILQMLLNNGFYNGKRYFEKATVEQFTCYSGGSTRRGLGWDKPEAKKGKSGPTSDNCSTYTFGHQGFTGTCVWADPLYNIQIIFLSNRTFPSAENKKITTLDVRPTIQKYAYDAFGIYGR
jgi:beta-N-acetylhexosaminidase